MQDRDRPASPLALAALALVAEGTTASGLATRFGDAGASLDPGVAAHLLGELSSLGLVRVGRGTGDAAVFVRTSLGERLMEGTLGGQATVALSELERLRTDLLSTIAHELRTPLTAIRTSIGLLLDETSKPSLEQRRTMLETIERNAARMQRIVGDILDIARFRSGAIRLQLRRFDATAMADAVAGAVAPLAQRRGQHIVLSDAGQPGPQVFGDHRRLEQALLNLVSNAQRFTPDGGRIELTVTSDDGMVRWSVTDEGPGVAPEDQPRLFERFFVGRGDRGDARQGVGLGLPTALAIAQAHGGTVDVRTQPGRGSTFTLSVPLDGPAEEA